MEGKGIIVISRRFLLKVSIIIGVVSYKLITIYLQCIVAKTVF
jgi:hypothetical protein